MPFKDAFRTTFPVLATQRLALRRIDPSEFESYYRNQVTARQGSNRGFWSFGPEMASPEKARVALGLVETGRLKNKERLRWGLYLRHDKALIGAIELFGFRQQSLAEMQFWLAGRHQNQGFMTEAGSAVLDFAFYKMNLHRVQATLSPTNLAGVRVLTKLQFRREGVLRRHVWRDPVWEDATVVGLLREEWQAREPEPEPAQQKSTQSQVRAESTPLVNPELGDTGSDRDDTFER